jgi:hypothetical protein
MTKTLEALEEQRARALELADGMEAERNEMRAKMAEMQRREEELRKRSKKLEAEGAADFLKRVQEAEANVAAVVRELQQTGGTFRDVDAARAKIAALQTGVLSDLNVDQPAPPEAEDLEIDEGDTVLLLDIGSQGVVVQAPSKNGDVQVKVGPLTMKTKLDRLRKVQPSAADAKLPAPGRRLGSLGGGGGGGGKTGKTGKKKGGYKQMLGNAVRCASACPSPPLPLLDPPTPPFAPASVSSTHAACGCICGVWLQRWRAAAMCRACR